MVEAAPPGAAEDHWSCWNMQTRDYHSCCICVCSSSECNRCETFFLQCSSLERASRSLAKTGLFFSLSEVFFSRLFSVRFFGGLGGASGSPWVDFGGIWGAFGGHFCDFLGIRLISQNVCFTIVKPYFLRFGRVLVHDLFVLCFSVDTFKVLFVDF